MENIKWRLSSGKIYTVTENTQMQELAHMVGLDIILSAMRLTGYRGLNNLYLAVGAQAAWTPRIVGPDKVEHVATGIELTPRQEQTIVREVIKALHTYQSRREKVIAVDFNRTSIVE